MRGFREVSVLAIDNESVNIKRLSLRWIALWTLIAGVSLPVIGQLESVTLTGLFEMTVTTTSSDFVDLSDTSLNLVLGLGDVTMQLDTSLTDTFFDTLTLSATGPLGSISWSSALRFNPSTAEFVSWQSGASFTLLSLAIANTTNVLQPQTESYTQWSISGGFEDTNVQTTIKMGVCPFEFWEANACATWVWFDCNANLSICAKFDCEVGFRDFTTSMSDLVLFDEFGILGKLGMTITYGLDEKAISPSLKLEPSWFFCSNLELLAEFDVSSLPISVDSLGIYGFRGECEISDCITFSFADSLDEAKNSAVTGKAEYFERFTIAGCLPSCCASPGAFEINAYFERSPGPSNTLFGLGLVTASFDIQLFKSFSFGFEASLPTVAGGGDWELAWTFRVLW